MNFDLYLKKTDSLIFAFFLQKYFFRHTYILVKIITWDCYPLTKLMNYKILGLLVILLNFSEAIVFSFEDNV